MKNLIESQIEYLKQNYLTQGVRTLARNINSTEMVVRRYLKELDLKNPKYNGISEQKELKEKGLKKCGRCKQIFPLNTDYFFLHKHKNKPFYYNNCKECQRKIALRKHQIKFSSLESYAKFICKFKKYKHQLNRYDSNLTEADIINQFNLQKGKCFYTGEDLKFESNSPWTISLDRMNSKEVYTKNNIVLCCYAVNMMKQSMTVEDFTTWCQRVANHRVVDLK